ncbi:hypothetical protein M2133_000199 [Parabacteroides sp. PF5-6]|nr:hypothetical protein [Parabacteroides sp. PF5-6]
MARRKISNSQAVCIILLWGTLCYMLLAYSEITFYTLFVLVASAVIVFVPLYKNRRNQD